MKKLIALILAVVMCISIFAGCGNNNEEVAKEPEATPEVTPEATPEAVEGDEVSTLLCDEPTKLVVYGN